MHDISDYISELENNSDRRLIENYILSWMRPKKKITESKMLFGRNKSERTKDDQTLMKRRKGGCKEFEDGKMDRKWDEIANQ